MAHGIKGRSEAERSHSGYVGSIDGVDRRRKEWDS